MQAALREAGLLVASKNLSKEQVKTKMLSLNNGQYLWEKLQGRMYGKFFHKASLFPGVKSFLATCVTRQIPVSVVSHKTTFGNHDESGINLRDTALLALSSWGLFSSNLGLRADDVFFADTVDDKNAIISELKLTHFVDDLISVREADSWSPDTEFLLFNPEKSERGADGIRHFGSWVEIAQYLVG